MITLDAGVIIAFFTPGDAHHVRAVALLTELADRRWYISAMTQAEVLVHAAQVGQEEDFYLRLQDLGIISLAVPPDDGVWLAQLRAKTGSRLPDCCVILAAQQSDSEIATFDARLAQSARELGIGVIPD